MDIIEPTSKDEELLSPEFLHKLEQLSLVAKRVFPGRMRGERRSSKRGASVEFADYRNYTIGDDFRRVDWNVYARLEKLFMKLFIEEEDLHVYVLIDASRSMAFGSPSKLLYAKRIAAALGYIALSGLDKISYAALSGDTASILPPKRGKGNIFPVFDWLNGITGDGRTKLADSIRDFTLRTRTPGIAVLISDCFDQDYEKGILALLSRRFEVSLIHVLDDEELRPTIVGDIKLIDSETGDEREISVSPALLRRYEQAVAAFCSRIESFCLKYGVNYIRTTVGSDFEDLILNYLRRRGMVK
ncbi:MAG: DUF58 domain-containing protein [Armatimonadota bacterium]